MVEVASTATVGRAAGWDDESTSVRVCRRRSGASVGPSVPLLVRKRRFAIPSQCEDLLGLRLTCSWAWREEIEDDRSLGWLGAAARRAR